MNKVEIELCSVVVRCQDARDPDFERINNTHWEMAWHRRLSGRQQRCQLKAYPTSLHRGFLNFVHVTVGRGGELFGFGKVVVRKGGASLVTFGCEVLLPLSPPCKHLLAVNRHSSRQLAAFPLCGLRAFTRFEPVCDLRARM